MKKNLVIISLLISACTQIMAMVPVEPEVSTDHQLSQVRSEYQQKWRQAAAADKKEQSYSDSIDASTVEDQTNRSCEICAKLSDCTSPGLQTRSFDSDSGQATSTGGQSKAFTTEHLSKYTADKGNAPEELIPYSNNIVEMFLHNHPAYQKTFGSLPRDVSKLFARRVLDAIPSVKNCLERCLREERAFVPAGNLLHSWKTEHEISYPPKPEGLPEAYYHPSPIYPFIPSPVLATFDQTGKYIAYVNQNYRLEICNASSMKCVFRSPNNLELKNIIRLKFIKNNHTIMALDESGKAYIWKFKNKNKEQRQFQVPQNYFVAIQHQLSCKKEFLARLNAEGVDENDPFYGFKRFFEGREILEAHYDYANKRLYALGKARDNEHSWLVPNSYHDREIIIYDLKKAKIIFHFKVNHGTWKESPEIANCLCVHDATGQMFFHESGRTDETKHILAMRSRIIEEENEQAADLQRVEETDFMRNMTLDQALALCILFQHKRQNLAIDLEQYPQLKFNCPKLPQKLIYYFFASKNAYESDKTEVAKIDGYPAKDDSSCAIL